MRAGDLDRLVIVQRKSSTPSDSGENIDTWAAIGSERWASKAPVSGEERYGTEQLAAKDQVKFELRYDDALSDLQPQDRIIEPSTDASLSPVPTRSIYDIISVMEIDRRDGIRVMATRRSDVS